LLNYWRSRFNLHCCSGRRVIGNVVMWFTKREKKYGDFKTQNFSYTSSIIGNKL